MWNQVSQFFKRSRKKIISGLGICVGFVALTFLSLTIYDNVMYGDVAYSDESSECSVLGINIHGALLTYVPPNMSEANETSPEAEQLPSDDVVGSEDIVGFLHEADQDPSIKAVILEVDSPGGMPVAGEEISKTIKEMSKPTVAVIRQSGLSAAYWAISSAERIFASRNSDVGSIGVTSSYLDNVGKNKKDGNDYVQLSSGKYKDAGDPDKPLTEEEKALFLRDIKIVHQNFIGDVASNRKIPVEEIEKIADGSSVLGEKAKSLGLIDEIGGWTEAENYLENKIGEKPEVCWQ